MKIYDAVGYWTPGGIVIINACGAYLCPTQIPSNIFLAVPVVAVSANIQVRYYRLTWSPTSHLLSASKQMRFSFFFILVHFLSHILFDFAELPSNIAVSVCARLDKYEMYRLLLSLICLLDDIFVVTDNNGENWKLCWPTHFWCEKSGLELLSKNLAPLNFNQHILYVDPTLSCSIAKN